MAETLGFIGLGIMGQGMAANLLKAGHSLRVWNRTPSRKSGLLELGAEDSTSPENLAAQSDLVFICVSDTPDVEEVVLGPSGVVRGLRKGGLVVDHSTIDPQATRLIGQKLAKRGASMIDAPVSGGSEGALKGTLSIMAGGEAGDIERAMPYFKAMGRTITHMGKLGSGQLTKLVNQILVVGNTMAMSEALVFAQAAGLDLEKIIGALSEGAAGSWMFKNRGPQILKRDWKPGFTIDLQQKDLRLAKEAADQLGVPVQLTEMIIKQYKTLQERGLGGEGNHALIKALEFLSGIRVGHSAKDSDKGADK